MIDTGIGEDSANRLLDALVVGAGVSGLYQLHRLRQLGLDAKGVEAGSDIGGTWYWNCYPGARVDSDAHMYQYSVEGLWKGWQFSERFPSGEEILKYLHYVDETFNVSPHIRFNTRVIGAQFNDAGNFWEVTTDEGPTIKARLLVMCIGFASKPHQPYFKGLETFRGECHHTARWPQGGVKLEGKRVGVIGTGASGVQVIQEAGKVAKDLVVFQRTPNLTFPMGQSTQAEVSRSIYPDVFEQRKKTFGGFDMDFIPKPSLGGAAARRAVFDELWGKGGLEFWLGAYDDTFIDDTANDYAYAYWRDKVRQRIHKVELVEKLAPTVKMHPFGTKRPALEQVSSLDTFHHFYNLTSATFSTFTKSLTKIMSPWLTSMKPPLTRLRLLVFVPRTGRNMLSTCWSWLQASIRVPVATIILRFKEQTEHAFAINGRMG